MRRLTVFFAAAFALVAMAEAGFALAGPVATQGKQTARATTNVTVHMGEYYYTLDKTEALTGTVIFTIINDGDVGHDFLINGQKIPVIEKGQTAKLTVNFNTPSTGEGIEYQCTVGEHAIYGMRGFFKITQDPAGGGGGGGGGGAGGATGGGTGAGGTGGGSPTASVTFAPLAPGTIAGSATFTNVTGGVQVVINLTNCPAGMHPIHIHEGTSCTSTTTQGMHWGGTNGPGENIGPNGGEITCTAAMTGSLTHIRMNTPASMAWTIGPPAATNVIGHAMIVHSSTMPNDRHACGVIMAN
jgi:Cu/Zn superoxide dismutase